MCGIFGCFSFEPGRVSDEVLRRMASSIEHRGPDAMGFHSDERAALGNTRLSILDLQERSNQPMFSDDSQIAVVQNGEIYNYIELREELKSLGAIFRTTGDTEVLLHAYIHWGPNFVKRLNGMFAIAVYDRQSERMWLYRDRLGVKPLYLTVRKETGRIWFASEIKALFEAGIEARPNYDALAQFLALNYVPQPHTAFLGIEHLPPASMAEITAEGINIRPYWDLLDIVPDRGMTEEDAREELLALLYDATRIRMRSDAQFGAFLSGGLDSSSVVGMMSRLQEQPVRTYSIGFADPRFDESHFAEKASALFGTSHTNQIMLPDATSMWNKFIWHTDQPHGDISFIPMAQVAKLAAKDVKMVLTGDGGDELFAGYDKYLAFFGDGDTSQLKSGWDKDFVRQSGLLLDDEPDQLLRGSLREAFHDRDPYRELSNQIALATHQDPINRVLFAETKTLLPGNNLVKPDRMAMAHSLEVRSPFLDYRMAEFAFRVPGDFKLRNGVTKAIYKDAVEPMLGHELTHRKKQMFTVPVGEWFRESLAPFCQELLFSGRFEDRGIIDVTAAERMHEQHIAGEANYTRQIRAMISLEIWFRIFIDRETS
ncbi:asparagine synthase (glutamine-hydrolyzing) [uncultured Rubinisphaera sp.]|uniref:asparagine synthase (glutamine-hydrolyzing) n=1 Tax=uncultured Rubinisphaera sp. TaxID=1678686 RepID=UPI0030D78D48